MKKLKEVIVLKCPNCKSKHLVKNGLTKNYWEFGRKQKYKCKDCGYVSVNPISKKKAI